MSDTSAGLEEVKALRDETGVSIMQCKKALEAAGGDMDKARVILKKQSGEAAEKKSGRALSSGTVGAYIHGDGEIAALALLSCETDFVAKNKEFIALAHDIAMQVAATDPAYLSSDDIPEDERARAREVFLAEAADKPEEIREKIVSGKLNAHFKDTALLTQDFIKEPEHTVKDVIDRAVQKFGERIEVTSFARLSAR